MKNVSFTAYFHEHYTLNKWNNNGFLLYIGSVFGNLNAIQISLWKSNKYAPITPYLHSFLGIFAHIWSNWYPIYVVLSLNCEFNWNLSMKYNSFCFFFGWLLSFRMPTLKSPIMMIGQCWGDSWIIVWILFKYVEIEHEWTLYTPTILLFFVY